MFTCSQKTPVLEPLFTKVAGLKTCNFIKRESNTGVFCENRGILKKTYFKEHRTANNSIRRQF